MNNKIEIDLGLLDIEVNNMIIDEKGNYKIQITSTKIGGNCRECGCEIST